MVQQVHAQPMITTSSTSNRPIVAPVADSTLFEGSVCLVAVSKLTEQGDGYALDNEGTVVGE